MFKLNCLILILCLQLLILLLFLNLYNRSYNQSVISCKWTKSWWRRRSNRIREDNRRMTIMHERTKDNMLKTTRIKMQEVMEVLEASSNPMWTIKLLSNRILLICKMPLTAVPILILIMSCNNKKKVMETMEMMTNSSSSSNLILQLLMINLSTWELLDDKSTLMVTKVIGWLRMQIKKLTNSIQIVLITVVWISSLLLFLNLLVVARRRWWYTLTWKDLMSKLIRRRKGYLHNWLTMTRRWWCGTTRFNGWVESIMVLVKSRSILSN